MDVKNPRAKELAAFEEKPVQEFDPEEERAQESSDEDGSEADELGGTEHYVNVGKSKLRKKDEVALGPEYAGSKISRKALEDDSDDGLPEDQDNEDDSAEHFADPDAENMEIDEDDEEIDSDEALGESDEERFEKFTFRGSNKPREGKPPRSKRPTAADFMSASDDEEQAEEGEDDDGSESEEIEGNGHESAQSGDGDSDQSGSDSDQSDDDEGEDDDIADDVSEESAEMDENEAERRAELRKLMSEAQKNVVATISQAAKADVDKGNAVKQQRKTFDSFLNVRIRLQKGLVSVNTLGMANEDETKDSATEPYKAAEDAAIKLWNTLDKLRHQLAKSDGSKTGQKRKRDIDAETPSSKIWERMESLESGMLDTRQTTLEKWSAKVRGATAQPVTRTRQLKSTAQQTITDVIADQLSNSERLIKRTKMPRSCAPLQAQKKVIEDPEIYDDAEFYQLLLKELVDQRMADSSAAAAATARPLQWAAMKEAKTKKIVDTKASKGRKMRFTVHEKLQNFMAPEDRGTWEQEAVDRFFGTLLGQKMNLGEEDEVSEEEDVPAEEQGLRLFRS